MKKWFACLVLVGLMVNQRSMAQEGGIVCMSGDCENGSGEAMLLLEDTMYYKGTFVNGVLEGNGRLNNPGKFRLPRRIQAKWNNWKRNDFFTIR